MGKDIENLCEELHKIYKKYELNETWLKIAGAIRVVSISNYNKISAIQLKSIIGDGISTELVWGILKTLEKYDLVTAIQENYDSNTQLFLVNDEFMIQRLFETVKLLGGIESQVTQDDTLYWTPPKEVNLNFKLLKSVKRIDSLISNLITQSRESLIFLAPFYSAEGLGKIAESLLPLINNQPNLKLEFFCNDLDNFEKRNRIAFESLKNIINHGSEKIPYKIFIPNTVAQKYENILIHAKFIISDRKTGYLGSANISKSALESQLELGVRISENQCQLISKILNELINQNYFVDVTNTI